MMLVNGLACKSMLLQKEHKTLCNEENWYIVTQRRRPFFDGSMI